MCQAGYFSYPYCEICGCDPRGTTSDICDQESAECFCKKHVTGPQCTLCKEDSFNLQESNEEGCTKCFCFGKTTRCTSSNLIKILLIIMDGWKLVALNESDKLQDMPVDLILHDVDSHTLGAELTSESVKGKVVYFSAPDAYLGKKLTTYGGYLNYTVFYTIGLSGK